MRNLKVFSQFQCCLSLCVCFSFFGQYIWLQFNSDISAGRSRTCWCDVNESVFLPDSPFGTPNPKFLGGLAFEGGLGGGTPSGGLMGEMVMYPWWEFYLECMCVCVCAWVGPLVCVCVGDSSHCVSAHRSKSRMPFFWCYLAFHSVCRRCECTFQQSTSVPQLGYLG